MIPLSLSSFKESSKQGASKLIIKSWNQAELFSKFKESSKQGASKQEVKSLSFLMTVSYLKKAPNKEHRNTLSFVIFLIFSIILNLKKAPDKEHRN